MKKIVLLYCGPLPPLSLTASNFVSFSARLQGKSRRQWDFPGVFFKWNACYLMPRTLKKRASVLLTAKSLSILISKQPVANNANPISIRVSSPALNPVLKPASLTTAKNVTVSCLSKKSLVSTSRKVLMSVRPASVMLWLKVKNLSFKLKKKNAVTRVLP